MKKLIAFATAFSMILSILFSIPVNAETVKVSDDDASNLMQALGIMNDETDKEDTVMTRETFAFYLAKAMNFSDDLSDVRYFRDVETTAFSVSAINYLTKTGVISVGDDKLFKPNANITYGEAIKMIVCAMGGREIAEVKGGFPFGYMTVARQLDISVSANVDDKITFDIAAVLLYNALTKKMVDIKSIGSDGTVYKLSDDSLLKVYWDIEQGEGVVNSVYGATLSSLYEAENPDDIFINADKYKIGQSGIDILNIIGHRVEFGFKNNNSLSEKTLVYVVDKTDAADIIKIDTSDFLTYKDNTITYYAGDKTQKKSLESPGLFYNGKELGSKVDETLSNLNKGYIYVIDTNADNRYDTLLIYDFINFKVGSVYDEVVFSKLNGTDYIKKSECDSIIVRDGKNNTIDFNDIALEDSLSVAFSKDKKAVVVLKADTEFNGVLDMVSSSSGKYMISVGDSEHEVEPSYVTYFKNYVKTGENYYYIKDVFGYICHVSAEQTSNKSAGYIVSVVKENVFSPKLKFKILVESGKVDVFTTEDKIILDGESYKDNDLEKVYDILTSFDGDLVIRYIADKDNNISEIDTTRPLTAKENEENSITSAFGESKKEKWFYYPRINAKAAIQSTTKVFYVPYDETNSEDDDYSVGTYTVGMTSNEMVSVDAFYFSSFNGFADVVLRRYKLENLKSNKDLGAAFMIFKEVIEKVNESGYTTKYIVCVTSSGEASYEMRDDISLVGIEKGDFIRLTFDFQGRVVKPTSGEDVKIVYDCSKEINEQDGFGTTKWFTNSDNGFLTYNKPDATTKYRANYQVSYGKAVDITADNVLRISASGDDVITEGIANIHTSKIVVIENGRNGVEIRSGTSADIVTRKSSKTEASKVFYGTHEGTNPSVIVYNL